VATAYGEWRVQLDGIRLGTTGAALRDLGLAVEDGRTQVGGVTLEAVPGEGILGLALDGAPQQGPLPLVHVEPGGPTVHALGATAVDHVVVLCGDVLATVDGLGVEPRRVEERDGRRYAYVVAQTALLEFVGPVVVDDRPARPWGLALAVDDIDRAAARLGDACGVPRAAVQPGRRIATVRHERIGLGVPTVLLSPRP
jgi:hypothetical protein